MKSEEQASQYIVNIRELGKALGGLSDSFRKDIPQQSTLATDKYSADNWRRNTYGNVLVRLRQITQNNFQVIETLSLLVTARYVFETSIWLRLFGLNKDYCLVYYKELLTTQLRHYEDSLAQMHREIALLKRFGEMDKKSSSSAIDQAIESSSVADFGSKMRLAMDSVDAEAARYFSIYSDQAKTNGYELQALLVEKKAIPPIEASIVALKNDISELEQKVPASVKDLMKGRWQWRGMSERAGILDEHDYIYSYASKLVHATPASITTDQKNLEMSEVCIFLRYIHVKLLEIIDLARSQPEVNAKSAP
jgi:hypothetical protein